MEMPRECDLVSGRASTLPGRHCEKGCGLLFNLFATAPGTLDYSLLVLLKSQCDLEVLVTVLADVIV
jgi:hypothetical protein